MLAGKYVPQETGKDGIYCTVINVLHVYSKEQDFDIILNR